MGVSRVYFDSHYLLEVVFEGKHKDEVERLLYATSRGGFEVFVPQTVLGETVSKILTRGKDAPRLLDRLARTLEKHGIDARRCLPPAPKRAFAIMEELRKRDERLDATDTMILAQVMADPDSKFFFTLDVKMTRSQAVATHEKELRRDGLRNEKLKITDRM